MVENLAKAMVIYIYRFKGSPEEYHAYLLSFERQMGEGQKWKMLMTASIIGQFWINGQEEEKNGSENKWNVYL